MQQAYTRMKNKNNLTEEACFYSKRRLFFKCAAVALLGHRSFVPDAKSVLNKMAV